MLDHNKRINSDGVITVHAEGNSSLDREISMEDRVRDLISHQWNLQNYLESAINKLSKGQYNFIRFNHSDYFDDQLKGGCFQN